uniref:Uncharacterized protein n=1 Tax=Oryza brachyantha TaxID=4533 RepID=J3LPV9_ORYBR
MAHRHSPHRAFITGRTWHPTRSYIVSISGGGRRGPAWQQTSWLLTFFFGMSLIVKFLLDTTEY